MIEHGCHWLTVSGYGHHVPLGLQNHCRKRIYRGHDLLECPGEFWDILGGEKEHVRDVKGSARVTRFDYAIDIPDGPDPFEVWDAFKPAENRRGGGWRQRGAKIVSDDGKTVYIGKRGTSPVMLCVYNQRGPTRFEFRFSSVNNLAEAAVASFLEDKLLNACIPLLWFYPRFEELVGRQGTLLERKPLDPLKVALDRKEKIDRRIHRARKMLAEFAAVYGSEWMIRIERIIEHAMLELDIEPLEEEPPF